MEKVPKKAILSKERARNTAARNERMLPRAASVIMWNDCQQRRKMQID